MRVRLPLRQCSLAAIVVTSLITTPADAQSPTKSVLIISGGPEEFPGSSDFDVALKKVL